jgi:hypothetical protein
MADIDCYTTLLHGAKSMLRHAASLYVQSYSAAPDECAKLRSRAFQSFIDAQVHANRAHQATKGENYRFLGPQLDEEIERLSPHDKI